MAANQQSPWVPEPDVELHLDEDYIPPLQFFGQYARVTAQALQITRNTLHRLTDPQEMGPINSLLNNFVTRHQSTAHNWRKITWALNLLRPFYNQTTVRHATDELHWSLTIPVTFDYLIDQEAQQELETLDRFHGRDCPKLEPHPTIYDTHFDLQLQPDFKRVIADVLRPLPNEKPEDIHQRLEKDYLVKTYFAVQKFVMENPDLAESWQYVLSNMRFGPIRSRRRNKTAKHGGERPL